MAEEQERQEFESAEESIETVRDILLGEQSREWKDRFAALEERLSREIAQLRDELRAAMEPFKQYVRSELAALGENLNSQSGQIDGQGKTFDSKLLTLEERAAQRLRLVETSILERAHQLSEEMRKRNEAVMSAMRRAMEDLDTRKPDRTGLAALFVEVAAHLSRESSRETQRPSAEEEPRSTH
jgi:hypothetical protein